MQHQQQSVLFLQLYYGGDILLLLLFLVLGGVEFTLRGKGKIPRNKYHGDRCDLLLQFHRRLNLRLGKSSRRRW